MANNDNPHGLGFVGMDGPGFPMLQHFSKVVGLGVAIFQQDAVQRVADGSIEGGGTPGSTLITGVAQNYGALSTATEHDVIVSSDALFEAQDNNATDGIAAADLGLNANLQYNAGSTVTLQSGHEINETGAAVTASLDVHLLELLNAPDNAYGSWARIVIKINGHRYGFAAVGV